MAIAERPVAAQPVQLVAGGLTLTLDLAHGARVVSAECAAQPGANLIDRWWCGYNVESETWSDTPHPGEKAFAGATIENTAHEVTARASAPHLRLEKRFTLYPGLPFVRVRYRTETTGLEGRGAGMQIGLPAIAFSPALVDPFDLDEDTADDGQELQNGLELPAWRIFADPSGAFGLVVFAARRQTMSRLQVTERGCAFRPAYYQAYSSEVVTNRFLNFSLQYSNFGPVDEVDWFIGAYDRETWPAMRQAIAGFHARRRPAAGGEVLETDARVLEAGAILPPLNALPQAWPALDLDEGEPLPLPGPDPSGGRVIGAAELAPAATGWQVVQRPGVPGGCALLARCSSGAEPLRIEPGLHGAFDVYAGVARGIGFKYKVDGDPYWSYLTTESNQKVQTWQAIDTLCRGDKEVLVRRVRLDGRGISIAAHPNLDGVTILTHLRFAPSPEPETLPVPLVPNRKRYFAGLSDIPVVAHELAADSFLPETWRDVVYQHAAHGIDTVYWRIDGQCSDFHTKIGTVRYSTPRVHNLYTPSARFYGLALRRVDPLRIAVEESRRWGLRLFGWMRTNNYSGNVVSQFFVDHPEWHDERENGRKSPSLCLAFPEVRAHKVAILCEAAAYGLDGLLVDTLRHPPLVHYHPVMVQAFRAEYGEDPPREPETQLDWGAVDNRVGERWERWFRFRARYVTQMFRELREALRDAGMAGLPVHIRVAPRRFLHDGADLEALLSEGLVDGVVANRYHTDPLDYERLFPVVRERVPICAICDSVRPDPVEFLETLQRDSRLTGVGMYESEWSVHVPEHRTVLLNVARRLKEEGATG